MTNDNLLSEKERALIGIGASVAAGCQPCTTYHVKAARTAGACDRSVALAVETALIGRKSSTAAMDEWAGRCQDQRPEVDDEFRAQKRLIAELTAIATAVAVNSVPELQEHLTAARDAGARGEQIRVAIEIARKIKGVAAEKIDAIADRIEEDARPTTATVQSTCCGSTESSRPEATVAARTDCGCR